MRTVTPETIAKLQKNPKNIRNICILAHVDHGKTTLADTLVASNGIISQRMAGKLRYLDSREDEQLRGITMKSSAISLHHQHGGEELLVNLIDSPGHIDFSSEVSTAVRLCDGAIVLVDVVEGVCPQTLAVLRQAWLENIKPVLVLNKLDRLISELKMTPSEAHLHLQQILEQVNAITGELFTSHVLEQSSQKAPGPPAEKCQDVAEDQVYDWSSGLEETDDSSLYFSPDQGNVLFASAIDGWGFGISHFADLFAAKLGFKAEVLRKTLWGDFYLETKTKRIKKGAQGKGKKPLFVQFILENLWSVYDAVIERRDPDQIEKIVRSMNLKIQTRDLRGNDRRVLLHSITSQWLPLSKAVLGMVAECLPSPLDVTPERIEKLLCSNAQQFDSMLPETQQLKQSFLACSPGSDAPVVVYVSKMFSADWKMLPQNRQRPLTQEEIAERREMARQRLAEKATSNAQQTAETPEITTSQQNGKPLEIFAVKKEEADQVFIAFARVFSGTVRKGSTLYVLGPKHDPLLADEMLAECDGDVDAAVARLPHVKKFMVQDLYLFMGKELEAMEEVPAGNLLGLGGLEEHVLKSATLSSTLMCPGFTDMYFEASPIVRVALEPVNAGDMRRLVDGLRLLNQADACVHVNVETTGELVIMAAGEVHLQKCLDDLKDKFAKVEVNVSEPLVPFRETIIIPPETDMVNEVIGGQVAAPKPPVGGSRGEEDEEITEPGVVELQTANRLCNVRLRAVPLPEDVTRILENNTTLIKTLDTYATKLVEHNQLDFKINQSMLTALKDLKSKLEEAFNAAGPMWKDATDQIWSFGPKRYGPNLLLNRVPEYPRTSVWICLEASETSEYRLWDFDNSVISGFQMATLSGPLCDEPLCGVCFIVEKWDMDKELRLRERKLSERERKTSERERRISGRLKIITELFGDDSDEEFNRTGFREFYPGNPDLKNETKSEGASSGPQTNEESCDKNTDSKDSSHQITETTEDNTPSSLSDGGTCQEQLDNLTLDNQVVGTHEADQAPVDIPEGEKLEDARRRDLTIHGPFSGQLMSCIKEGCRRAFMSQPQRLMVAMYSCVIQATADVLGKLYGVLGKRNGRILYEDMREGTSVFNISAVIPVIESFGFAEEIRKKTSGLASPQLRFSHWEVIDLDPFWVPTTEEEYLHFGEKADSENQVRRYMNQVRRRKGLKVDEKLVEFAEKQRTLSKNK